MPRQNLEPPHYDGVQSLAMKGNHLFTFIDTFSLEAWTSRVNINKKSGLKGQDQSPA